MIISLNNKTRIGKGSNRLTQPGMYYSMFIINVYIISVRSYLCKRSGTVINDMYCNTKLGMKSMTFCYMEQSKLDVI